MIPLSEAVTGDAVEFFHYNDYLNGHHVGYLLPRTPAQETKGIYCIVVLKPRKHVFLELKAEKLLKAHKSLEIPAAVLEEIAKAEALQQEKARKKERDQAKKEKAAAAALSQEAKELKLKLRAEKEATRKAAADKRERKRQYREEIERLKQASRDDLAIAFSSLSADPTPKPSK